MARTPVRRFVRFVPILVGLCAPIALEQGTAQAVTPLDVWNGANATIDAVKKMYALTQWISCLQGNAGNCPESDAHKEASRVISELGTLVEKIDTDHAVAGVQSLLDESQRLYGDPTHVSHDDENALVMSASDLFDYFVQKLNNTNPAVQAEVDAAYSLTPAFNILASLVDAIGRTALARGQVAMSWDWINERRNRTLSTNYALVGSASTWFQCTSQAPLTMANTIGSSDGSVVTKKLWKRFADYGFSYDSCANDCDIFRATTPGAMICRHSCRFICTACGVTTNDWTFPHEFQKILAKMDKDQVVQVVRAAMDDLVALGELQGSGVLWATPDGEIDMSIMADPSFNGFPLANVDLTVWKPLTTGDFNGDGTGDILWLDDRDGLLSLWTLSGQSVTSMTPATYNVPHLGSSLTPIVGDLDGDGVDDIVWTGTISIGTPGGPITIYNTNTWIMNPGTTTPRSSSAGSSQTDHLEGLGAFARVWPDPDPAHHDILQQLNRTPSTSEVSISDAAGNRTTLAWVGPDWVIKGVAKFNGESTDILWYQPATGNVSIWSVRGNQLVSAPLVGTVDPSYGWTIKGFGDTDHDGTSDIIWEHTSGNVSIWKMAHWGVVSDWFGVPTSVNPGDTFIAAVSMGPPPPANGPRPSLDQDAFCSTSARNGRLLLPGFADSETWSWTTFDGGYGTMIGDVNGDGRADLVTLSGSGVQWMSSNGNGFGDSQSAWAGGFFWGNHGNLLGDVTGDGKADLIGLGDGYVGVLPAVNSITPFGGYQTWWYYTFDGGLGSTMIGDIDGDGKADLVTLGSGYVDVLHSKGNGFEEVMGLNNGFQGYYGTLLGDIDRDGKADLVALINGAVVVRRATGSLLGGTLFGNQETWSWGTFYGTRGTYLRDVDGDGYADLVAVGDYSIKVMRSNGSGFGSPEIWWGNAFYGSHGTLIGDVDANGKADLVATGDGSISVIRPQ